MTAHWTSEAIRPSENTCLDVSAFGGKILVHEVGEASTHTITLGPDCAIALAAALLEGVDHADDAA